MVAGQMEGFREDAVQAMTTSPNYFAVWYTAKSLLLVAAVATIAYIAGRSKACKR